MQILNKKVQRITLCIKFEIIWILFYMYLYGKIGPELCKFWSVRNVQEYIPSIMLLQSDNLIS